MNQSVSTPVNLQPTSCPLLTAVLPVRYAIGPVYPRHPANLDATSLGLPVLDGQFPDLGPDHPQLVNRPLGYVPRMLRDGWLYVWDETLGELSEYQVRDSLLILSGRGDGLKDKTSRPYLMLAAGAPVRLTWSPVQWSADTFGMVEQQSELRQRLMREIMPGVGPFSGQVQSLHSQIGDIRPENFRWSCAPEPRYWLLEDPPLKQMKRCEQHHFALVDDPWGVLFDTAGLMRARAQAFDKLHKHRADEWSIAAIVQSMSNGDEKIRNRIASIINQPQIDRLLQEQARETAALEADRLRLADVWVAWFNTLGENTPSSLESACEHFDICEPVARDMLEASFAGALLGPAATSSGVRAIEQALDLTRVEGEPWLLWAILGLPQRLDAGQLQQLLEIPDDLLAVAEDTSKASIAMARAAALAAALNWGAEKLARLPLAGGGEPLFAAVSTVLGGHLPSLAEQVQQLTYGLMIAMLARSRQRVEATSLSPEEALSWMSDQVASAHNKGQQRSLERRIAKLERQNNRVARMASSDKPAKSSLAIEVKAIIPHFRLSPSTTDTPAKAPLYNGYSSTVLISTPRPVPAPPVLPQLSGQSAGLALPPNIKDLINEAPLKTLIVMVSVWNLGHAGKVWIDEGTARNFVSASSAAMVTAAATTAVLQHLADTKWEQHVAQVNKINPVAQEYLARALGLGSVAMLFQGIAAGVDVFFFGWRALDAYRAGDLDSAGINTGLAGASLAYARLSVEAMRALRIARTAVLAGDAAALTTGLRVLSLPLRLSLVGLAVTIITGLVALFFTEDEPLEQWLKQTRFGTRPADWSGDLIGTLRSLYQVVLPVSLKLERWQDINPVTGQLIRELRLVLRLPGQQEYRQGMVSFDGEEEWQQKNKLFSARGHCTPLTWGEEDPIPFSFDIGSRVSPEPNGLRLRRVYHDDGDSRLIAVRGQLTYQPIDGLLLPPIDIELS